MPSNNRKSSKKTNKRRVKEDLVERSRLTKNKGSNIIKFDRTALVGPYTLVPATGFNATAFDMEMSFSLQQTLVYLGGTLTTTVTNPGYTEVVNLFQFYKIDKIEIMFIYSNNTSQVNNTLNLPVLQVAVDYSGVASITSAAILQFENLKVIQLGNYRGDAGPVFSFVPKFYENTNGGNNAYVGMTGQWIDALAPAAPHFGLKMVFDPISTSSATSVGNLEFYVRYHLSARNTN